MTVSQKQRGDNPALIDNPGAWPWLRIEAGVVMSSALSAVDWNSARADFIRRLTLFHDRPYDAFCGAKAMLYEPVLGPDKAGL